MTRDACTALVIGISFIGFISVSRTAFDDAMRNVLLTFVPMLGICCNSCLSSIVILTSITAPFGDNTIGSVKTNLIAELLLALTRVNLLINKLLAAIASENVRIRGSFPFKLSSKLTRVGRALSPVKLLACKALGREMGTTSKLSTPLSGPVPRSLTNPLIRVRYVVSCDIARPSTLWIPATSSAVSCARILVEFKL